MWCYLLQRNTTSRCPLFKNALDVGSRPSRQSIWDGKPAAIISQSPGSISGLGVNYHLRHSLTFLNMLILQQLVSRIDEDGNIKNELY